jgi:hypothetical protein
MRMTEMTLANLITMIDMVENHTDAIDLADKLWPAIRAHEPAQCSDAQRSALQAVVAFVGRQEPDKLEDGLLYELLEIETACRNALAARSPAASESVSCAHTEADKATAIAYDFCPVCLSREVTQLRALVEDARKQALVEAMKAIEDLRIRAATNFTDDSCKGQRGVDRCDALYDAYRAIVGLPNSSTVGEPK